MIKDYAVQIRIKNNWFLQRMHAAGFERVADLSRASGVPSSEIGRLVNLKKIPTRSRGNEQWRPIVLRLSDTMKCLPEDLFPPQHISKTLKRNTAIIELSAEEIPALMANNSTFSLPPSANLELQEAQKNVIAGFNKLTPRERRVIGLRFGLDEEKPLTLREVSDLMKVGTERIRQIECRALRRLRDFDDDHQVRLREAMETIFEQEGGAA